MSTRHPLTIAVVGAGLTGLSTAVLLARDGHRVTVLDRDPAPPPTAAAEAWRSWQRPGVNQFRQPHLMLPRWRQEVAAEIPDLLDRLTAAGVDRVNMLHLQPESVTHGWRSGDEQFDTVAARRPVLEATLRRLAEGEPALGIRRGCRVTGLLSASVPGQPPRIVGVGTGAGAVECDLVVDAAGRRTPLPGWLPQGARRPVEYREPCGFVYYSRHFHCNGGRPPAAGPVLSHLESMSVLTVPGDHDTFCLVLIVQADDRAMRELRHPAAWSSVLRCSPVGARWEQHGEPISDVLPIAGIEDVQRSYVDEEGPLATGIVALGDAAVATNPSLGRGASIGMMQAQVLRDVLRETSPDVAEELVTRFAAATAQRVTPWVSATLRFDRHRLAEMAADIGSTPYATEDPTWPVTTALLNGGDRDPVLTRASSRIGGMLATPPEVFADPAVGPRLGPFIGGPRYPGDHPTRADLLDAVGVAARR